MTPIARPPSVTMRRAISPSTMRIEGARDATAARASMIARPAPSPLTRTMRRCECAASREGVRSPASLRSKGTPKASRSSTRARASCAMPSAMAASTSPAPARIVSSACISGVSASSTAAAMPPCAQKEEAAGPTPCGASTMTGVGASFRAQNSPARPPPMMTMEESWRDIALNRPRPRRGARAPRPPARSPWRRALSSAAQAAAQGRRRGRAATSCTASCQGCRRSSRRRSPDTS